MRRSFILTAARAVTFATKHHGKTMKQRDQPQAGQSLVGSAHHFQGAGRCRIPAPAAGLIDGLAHHKNGLPSMALTQ